MQATCPNLRHDPQANIAQGRASVVKPHNSNLSAMFKFGFFIMVIAIVCYQCIGWFPSVITDNLPGFGLPKNVDNSIMQISIDPGCSLRAKRDELTIRYFPNALKVLDIDIPAKFVFNAEKDKELRRIKLLGNTTEWDSVLALKVGQLEDARRQELIRTINRQYRLISEPWHPQKTIAAAAGCKKYVEAVHNGMTGCYEALMSEEALYDILKKDPHAKPIMCFNWDGLTPKIEAEEHALLCELVDAISGALE